MVPEVYFLRLSCTFGYRKKKNPGIFTMTLVSHGDCRHRAKTLVPKGSVEENYPITGNPHRCIVCRPIVRRPIILLRYGLEIAHVVY